MAMFLGRRAKASFQMGSILWQVGQLLRKKTTMVVVPFG